MTLKIGISVRGFEWAGGIELLRHFVNALLLVRDVYPLEIHLLLPEDNYISSLRDVRTVGVQVLRRVLWDRSLSLPRRRARWDSSLDDYFLQVETGAIVAHRHENSLGGLLRCARKVGVNVLFPVKETVGPGFPIPWIGYIPDFQHRYLTHLFAPNECYK